MAKIQLTVAGIYFSAEIEVADELIAGGFTILDLMRQARRQTDLEYMLEEGDQPIAQRSMAIIQTTLPEGFVSRSGKIRQPGVYAIEERSGSEQTQAWQYYIERPNPAGSTVAFELISRTVGTSFKAPGVSEPLQDGDKVLWRCVSILRSPTGTKI
jgi:hypothetical protein